MVRLPSPESCLLISGPRLLLTASLISFVIALGIYLGFLMSLHLTNDSAPNDSRNVFIFYLVSAIGSYALFNQTTSILSGRTAGSLDDGDHFMIELLKRRKAILEANDIQTDQGYRQWKRHQGLNSERARRLAMGRTSHDEEAAPGEAKPNIATTSADSDRSVRPEPDNPDAKGQPVDENDAREMLRRMASLSQEQARLLERLAGSSWVRTTPMSDHE